ncbi:DUF2165 family protein [Streptomyces specialis]|uniref:DUF2165 family protein n=1 Tax=Streptomyces specialis TaxID=498367 RepID=UPI00073E9562|nr:DUF2165 family protein [Streptomyces specialis]
MAVTTNTLTENGTPLPGGGARATARPDHAIRSRLTALNAFLLSGLTLWLGLVTLNNVDDFGTNKALITSMITMGDLKDDPVRGNGLEWRALPEAMATPALLGVIVYEVLAVALLAWAATSMWRRARGETVSINTTQRANYALAGFMGLFFVFLCGGMFYGYWIYIGAAQQVHFTGLMIGLLTTVLVNLPSVTGAQKEH